MAPLGREQHAPRGLPKDVGRALHDGDGRRDERLERPPVRRVVGPDADRETSRLASIQCGVVTREQLVALDLARGAIDHRLSAGRLHLPITTPARTLLDLAEVLEMRDLERALDEALVRRLIDRRRLLAALARAPGRHGAAPLRALLRRDGGPTLTRSEAEERVLYLVRTAGLPRPEVNRRVEGHEVDLYWRHERLVVEIDGWRYHSSHTAFERDRRRDADLGVAGLRVMRVTWRQIVDEREALVAHLVRALMTAATPG